MPLIAPQHKPERQVLAIKVDLRLIELLKAYAECIASSQEYIVNEALLAMFVADKEFRGWLADTRPTALAGLQVMLEERPNPRGRSRATGAGPSAAARTTEAR